MNAVALMMHSDVPISVGGLSIFLSTIRTLEPWSFSALMPVMCQHVALLAERAVAPWTEVSLLMLDYMTIPTEY